MGQTVFVSATPADYEKEHSEQTVEQVIRPTGLLEPQIFIRPVDGQIEDIIHEIRENNKNGEKSLIMTLTKKMAEDLTEFLEKEDIRVTYLHFDIETVERMQILNKLRNDETDVIVGINLLREGIDLPEVSLLMILDADKEGFLRSERSLIQIIGRCARNSNGRVILYADEITDSMMGAVSETNRRRDIQQKYNEDHGIVPKTVIKHVKNVFDTIDDAAKKDKVKKIDIKKLIENNDPGKLTGEEREKLIATLTKDMKAAAKDLDFEKAASIRDAIIALKNGESK